MKIAIVSTDDIYGGAAIAAYRLHQALLAAGAESKMVVKNKHSDNPSVVAFGEEEKAPRPNVLLNSVLADYYITKNRVTLANGLCPTFFSFSLDDYDLSENSVISQADIINIHWCSGFFSARSIHKLLTFGKQIVWTMHRRIREADQRPRTVSGPNLQTVILLQGNVRQHVYLAVLDLNNSMRWLFLL